jgi:putative endonuclease
MESREEVWSVYILECSDGSFYVGVSTDVEQRFIMHATSRGAQFTKTFSPVRVCWRENHKSLRSARQREIQLKGWSRKKKLALISGII